MEIILVYHLAVIISSIYVFIMHIVEALPELDSKWLPVPQSSKAIDLSEN